MKENHENLKRDVKDLLDESANLCHLAFSAGRLHVRPWPQMESLRQDILRRCGRADGAAFMGNGPEAPSPGLEPEGRACCDCDGE